MKKRILIVGTSPEVICLSQITKNHKDFEHAKCATNLEGVFLPLDESDLVIDLGCRHETLSIVQLCAVTKKPVVIGTDNHPDAVMFAIEHVASSIAVVFVSENFITTENLLRASMMAHHKGPGIHRFTG